MNPLHAQQAVTYEVDAEVITEERKNKNKTQQVHLERELLSMTPYILTIGIMPIVVQKLHWLFGLQKSLTAAFI